MQLRQAVKGVPRAGRWPARHGFLLRLYGALLGTLAFFSAALYVVQTRDASEIFAQEYRARHLAQAQILQRVHAEAAPGREMAAVGHELSEFLMSTASRKLLVLDPSGRVVQAAPATAGATPKLQRLAADVMGTGQPVVASSVDGSAHVVVVLSRIELAGEPYTYLAVFRAGLLEQSRAAFRLSLLRALGVGAVLSLPLLWLFGGRKLTRRFRDAEERATTDGLTGLPNHRAFQEALLNEVGRANRYHGALSLALFDLDDFKFVNQAVGHRAGDAVLVQAARALAGSRAADRAFRVGGDTFALLMPHSGATEARLTVERIRARVAELTPVTGTTVSAGVVSYDGQSDAATVQEHAELALHEAKRLGRDRVVGYDPVFTAASPAVPSTVSAVRQLLSEGRVDAAFQPIWDMGSHRLVGVEGLARPPASLGLGPQEAFAGAARLGRVAELDEICRAAILSAAATLPEGVLLFLNVSPEVFDRGGQAAVRIRDEVLAAGLTPQQVVIELTERASERMDLVFDEIGQLGELGFHVAMDDVGAGDAGLGLLARVRPDFVKLDRSIVCRVQDTGSSGAVVAAVMAYAERTGAAIVAEGIETSQTLDAMADIGRGRVHLLAAQGYLLGRPELGQPWLRPGWGTWEPREEPAGLGSGRA